MPLDQGILERPLAVQQAQTPLPGSAIPQFVDPLPDLLAGESLIVDGGTQIELEMREHKAMVLPANTVPGYTGTYVWSYLKPGQASRTSYLGPVILATRGQPTEIKFTNLLGSAAATNVLAYKNSTDQTLHWADPAGGEMNMANHMANIPAFGSPEAQNYLGSIPAVPHLHGGEVPPVLDGGPDAWFLSDGSKVGHGYYSKDGLAAKNYCIYRYPNQMEGTLIWFHDHTLGATRLNVYAGLAGGYVIWDQVNDTLLTKLLTGQAGGLPELIPLVLQDRMFDTNGQFFFPADSLGGLLVATNPEHPHWVPEFVGDTIVVNGKAWPFRQVEQKRYTFMMINGSNARTYSLFLVDQVSGNFGPPLWVIATDGGYLDAPVKLDPAAAANNVLTIMPGERYWFIVDFAGFGAGTIGPNGKPYSGNWLLRNNAKTPYPAGAAPQGSTVGRVMQFRVGLPAADTSYNPATVAPLRTPMVRLSAASAVKTRQLTLNEVMGMPVITQDPVTGAMNTAYPGGPLEILVNNTKWDGQRIVGLEPPDAMGMVAFKQVPVPGFTLDQHLKNYLSEIPNEGETEIWEIVNTTADAHPMHWHLVQFQLLSRQNYNTNKYSKAYAAAFPAGFDFTMRQPIGANGLPTGPDGMAAGPGVFLPAWGPPLDYATGNPRALGGNPDITPYLQGPLMPPLPQESGWKDTVMMLPGMVTRIIVRWAPNALPANTPLANATFPFDPRAGGSGYVWHCHIVDHEDNEMMRPDEVNPQNVTRTYRIGFEY